MIELVHFFPSTNKIGIFFLSQNRFYFFLSIKTIDFHVLGKHHTTKPHPTSFFQPLTKLLYTLSACVINIGCRFGRIYSHYGKRPVGISTREILDLLHEGWKSHSECGWFHSIVWDPGLNERRTCTKEPYSSLSAS